MADWIAILLDGDGGIEGVRHLSQSSGMHKQQARRIVASIATGHGRPDRVAVIREDRLLRLLAEEEVVH
jgi:hypothetical protein